jgi:predicted acylesterase/phospholipase RssA
VLEEKYSNEELRRVLQRHLGDTRLRDALVPVLVPAYDIERRAPVFFKSARAVEDPDRDYAMADAALATASAPTYFEPVRVRSAGGTESALIDGGVFAVNPAMCAYAEARIGDPAAEVVIVSLGTGRLTRPIRYEDARGWGLVQWARPVIDVVFDGSSEVVDYQLRQLVGASFHRLQVTLDVGSDDLDDASASNLRLLRSKGEQLVAEHEAELSRLAAELTPTGR